jgi:hypothetical protein
MEREEDVRLATFLYNDDKGSQDWGRLSPGQTLLLDRLFYCRLECYLAVSESRSQEKIRLLCVVSASHVIPRAARMTLDAMTHTMQNPGQLGSTALYLPLLWKHLHLQLLCPWIEPHTNWFVADMYVGHLTRHQTMSWCARKLLAQSISLSDFLP